MAPLSGQSEIVRLSCTAIHELFGSNRHAQRPAGEPDDHRIHSRRGFEIVDVDLVVREANGHPPPISADRRPARLFERCEVPRGEHRAGGA